ncbi:very short patch repair endonuclease [Serinicoccus sp. CUA-874]|uniref:very short patch repair endonuclease n=1 Tax=Serinicoccus sp. CUA-874 TaxID=1517939 RepID=UPI00095BBEF9|nr:very short patch repair endonuclease [Serinicoccus sp. CUA-874]OLT16282.1 very short patch repair endonuclease [Serinicoccus sp. CUA-874]
MAEPRDDVIRRRMQRQRRRDTTRELEIRRELHALGYRFRVDYRMEPSLRSRGDIVFTRRRLVVFIDGCFWHGCPEHATPPKTNTEWWTGKLAANVARDRRVDSALTALGWKVLRVWEHEALQKAVHRIQWEIEQC